MSRRLDAIDLEIGDHVTIRRGLRLETRVVDIVSYRKNSVAVTFTDTTTRSYPNKEKVQIK